MVQQNQFPRGKTVGLDEPDTLADQPLMAGELWLYV